MLKVSATKEAFGDIGSYLANLVQGMDLEKIKPYMGFLNPVYQAVGGVGGIPAMAAMTDLFRGGENVKLLSRGLFQDKSAPGLNNYGAQAGQHAAGWLNQAAPSYSNPFVNMAAKPEVMDKVAPGARNILPNAANTAASAATITGNVLGQRFGVPNLLPNELGKQTKGFLQPLAEAGTQIKARQTAATSLGSKPNKPWTFPNPLQAPKPQNKSTSMHITNGAS